jgi:hypothetical protein
MEISEKQTWMIVGTFSALGAGIVAQMLLQRGWKRFVGKAPPKNPAAADTSWGEAILWTAVIGMIGGIARLMARRGAAEAWRLRVGHYPPGMESNDLAA